MKLTRLELNNFCQHEYLLWDIPKGLIGILGANGSGKSNIIRSIVYAITGLGTNRKQGLKQGASIGFVTLDFCTDSDIQNYRVCRELHTTKVELFQLINEKWTVIATGSEQVKTFFQEQLGMDTDVIRTILAVPQEDLVMFFHEIPSRRLEVLNRLFGLSFIANRRDIAKKCRDATRNALNAACTSMERIQAELSRQHTIYDHAQAILAATPVQPIDDLLKQQHEIACKIGECNSLRFQWKEIAASKQKLVELHKALNAWTPPEKPENLDKEAELLDEYNQVTCAYNRTQLITSTLNNLVNIERVRPACITDRDIADCHAAITELEVKKSVVYYRLHALNSDTCPICGTDIRDKTFDTQQADLELRALEEAIKSANAHLRQLTTAKKAYDDWVFRMNQEIDLVRRNDPKQTLLLGTTIFSDVATEANKKLGNYAEYLRKMKPVLEAFAKYHTDVADAERQTALFRLRIPDEELRLQSLERMGVVHFDKEEELACYESQLSRNYDEVHHTIQEQQKLAEPQANFKLASEAIQRLDAELLELKEKASHLQHGEVLDKVVELLQPNQLPVYVMRQLMLHLMELMNQYLTACGSNYTVSLSDDSDIICNKQTISQPVSRLSGGEKMLLAIAFRLAVHDAFSTSDTGGFIVLDEPTTFLDETNKACLTVALTNLLHSGTCNNKQIFVITHDLALQPLFESSLVL